MGSLLEGSGGYVVVAEEMVSGYTVRAQRDPGRLWKSLLFGNFLDDKVPWDYVLRTDKEK
jgi:hypothetical protein